MTLDYQRAKEQLHAWTTNPSLLHHAQAVEAVMRQAAMRYGDGVADEQAWRIAGLLHDADYQRWPAEHPKRIVAWLRDQGEEEIAYAVSAHYTKWEVTPKSQLDKALLACDELTGLIVACCLVRPDGIASLEPRSVKKKLKDKAFAAKVDRDEIQSGVRLLGVELEDHVRFVIDALRPYAEELQLAGGR